MSEIVDRHRGQWVLMAVTGHDEYGYPSVGSVVAATPSRQAISEALHAQPRATPKTHYYIFVARPRVPIQECPRALEGMIALVKQVKEMIAQRRSA